MFLKIFEEKSPFQFEINWFYYYKIIIKKHCFSNFFSIYSVFLGKAIDPSLAGVGIHSSRSSNYSSAHREFSKMLIHLENFHKYLHSLQLSICSKMTNVFKVPVHMLLPIA